MKKHERNILRDELVLISEELALVERRLISIRSRTQHLSRDDFQDRFSQIQLDVEGVGDEIDMIVEDFFPDEGD